MKKLMIFTAIFITNLSLAQKQKPWRKKYEYSQWDTNEILAATDKNGKSGYITKNGKVVIAFVYEKSLPLNGDYGNLGFVKKNKKWGAIDMKGNQKIEHLYDDIDFLRRLIRVKKNDKWGGIDTTGIQVVPFVYDKSTFSEIEVRNKIK